MATKKKPAPAKKLPLTPMQKHFRKGLKPFQHGSSDCWSFVADYVNSLLGKNELKYSPITFGEAVRTLRRETMLEGVGARIEPLGFKAGEPKDGSVVVCESADCLEGQAVGIYADGAVIVRGHSLSLIKLEDPKILKAWAL